MTKIIMTKQSKEQAKGAGDLELKFQRLTGISLSIKEGSLTDAVKMLEREAKRHGATHIFNLRYETYYPAEKPYRPLGHYEAIGDAYGPKVRK